MFYEIMTVLSQSGMLLLYLIPSFVMLCIVIFLLFGNEEQKKYLNRYKYYLLFILMFINGVIYISQSKVWNVIDEGSHFSYVQYLSENHTLPSLSDYTPKEVMAIATGVYPKESPIRAEDYGLGGVIYEAFQPPLYYLFSVPVYWLSPENFMSKVYILRFYGLIQFVLTVFVAKKIMDRMSIFDSENQKDMKYIVLVFLAFNPSILMRSVIIGNAALTTLIMTYLFGLLLEVGKERVLEIRDIIYIATLTGLAILSRFNVLYIFPTIIALFITFKDKLIRNSIIFISVALLVISPWFLYNLFNYGTLTTNNQAKEVHKVVVNPTNKKFGIEFIVSKRREFFSQLWSPEEHGYVGVRNSLPKLQRVEVILSTFLMIGIVLYSYFAMLYFFYGRKEYYFHFLSLIIVMAAFSQAVLGTIVGNWPIFMGRYLHPVMLPLSIIVVHSCYYLFHKLKPIYLKTSLLLIIVLSVVINIDYLVYNFFSQVKVP